MIADKREQLDEKWRSEWDEVQSHRYDPGYWLGGRIHPLYRRWGALGTTSSFGVALCILGLASGAVAIWWPPEGLRVSFSVLSLVFVALGISNVRAARNQHTREH